MPNIHTGVFGSGGREQLKCESSIVGGRANAKQIKVAKFLLEIQTIRQRAHTQTHDAEKSEGKKQFMYNRWCDSKIDRRIAHTHTHTRARARKPISDIIYVYLITILPYSIFILSFCPVKFHRFAYSCLPQRCMRRHAKKCFSHFFDYLRPLSDKQNGQYRWSSLCV